VIHNVENGMVRGKGKGFLYSLPSCHCFPLGLRTLPSQPQCITAHWPVPIYTAWWQKNIGVNNLTKPRSFAGYELTTRYRKSNAIPVASPLVGSFKVTENSNMSSYIAPFIRHSEILVENRRL